MKNFLIISYSYPPSQAPAAQRPFYLAKYLDKSKFKIWIITPEFSDSSMGYSESIENIENIEIIYTKNINISYLRKLKNVKKTNNKSNKISLLNKIKQKIYSFVSSIVIPDKGIFWVPFAIVKAFKVIKKNNINIIFTTSPLFSNHIVGLFLKKFFNIYWVADFRDFHYIENYQHTSLIRRHFDKILEKSVMNYADKVIFISESMKEEYCKYYSNIKIKAYAVYNGFEIEHKLKGDRIPKEQPLTIFYAGSFYAGERSPFPLLKVLDQLIIDKKLSIENLKIKIAGNIEEDLFIEMQKYKCFKCIKFLGLISREKVLKEIRNSHLLWLIVGDTKKHYLGFPIKGYEYIAAQRSILAFVPENSESYHIISKYNLGFIMYNKTDTKYVNKNINIFTKILDKYNNRTLNNVKYFDKNILNLTKESQIKKIEKILETLVS